MRDATPRTTHLQDYAPPPYRVETVELRFELGEGTTRVGSTLRLRRDPSAAPGTPLVLDGQDLELLALALDGVPLEPGRYRTDPGSLTVEDVPESFTLTVETRIRPEENTALEGLYRVGGLYCTQCEAPGMRASVKSSTNCSLPSVFFMWSAKSFSPQISSVGAVTFCFRLLFHTMSVFAR